MFRRKTKERPYGATDERKIVILSPIGRRIQTGILFLALFLSACTDYVSQIEDRYGEWKPNWPAVSGTMTDSRDGQSYKTVTIGTQTWMAQNLNYKTTNSYCYDDKVSNCTKYGRLYTWDATTTACPSDWHLPTKAEFETLIAAVGGESTAGKMLKTTSGWGSDGNGVDDYSFSVLPAGYKINAGSFENEGDFTYFWTSTETNSSKAYVMGLSFSRDAGLIDADKNYGYSVRCIKGEPVEKMSSSNKEKVSSSSKKSSSSSIKITEQPSSSSNKNVASSSSNGAIKSSSSVNVSSSSKKMESSSSLKNLQSSSGKKLESSSSLEKTLSSSSEKGKSSSSWSVVKGFMTDSRDGQTYKTLTIGLQTWMAENLNYETENSYCYNDSTKYCSKYGRLYTWAAVMDSVGSWSAGGIDCGEGWLCWPQYPVQGVCPAGWHLPTTSEFKTLFSAIGDFSRVGKELKSANGWNKNGDGTDTYSFTALPAGYRYDYGDYSNEGNCAYFWSSNEYDRYYAHYIDLSVYDNVSLDFKSKNYAFSVRCVKGDASKSSNREVLIDSRDNQTYRTVKIGSQTWMAENLNYKSTNSYCYNDSTEYCSKYGRLYTWSAAMDSACFWSTNGKGCGNNKTCSPTYPVRGVCPIGWHLPTTTEFRTMTNITCANSTCEKLKSMNEWDNNGNGSDAYKFSALPAGYRNDIKKYSDEGKGAYFWTSTENSVQTPTENPGRRAFSMSLKNYGYQNQSFKDYGYSIRCVKD